MGKNSSISWTDHSWNPWQGCKKVSPGCKNCYMFDGQKRWGNDPENIHRSAKQTFNLPNRLKKPCKVFVCSWSDFFIQEADKWRPEAWEIIRKNPHITFQILTKRPENIIDRLPEGWPFENVWLGVTAENQEQAAERIPYLLMNDPGDAVVKFVSIEPMLEPIELTEIHATCDPSVSYNLLTGIPTDWDAGKEDPDNRIEKIDWVICGGESGPRYRDMETEWAIELMCDCRAFNIPFFMKQMSAVNPKKKPIPDCINIQEFPK